MPRALPGGHRTGGGVSAGAPLFRSRPVAWLIGATTLATLAALLLLAFGDDDPDPTTAGANSYSRSAIGFRAAYLTLRSGGFRTTRNRDPRVPALTADAALVLTEPLLDPAEREGGGLLRHLIATADRRGRPTIVVLPKWIASVSQTDPRYVDGVTPHDPAVTRAVAAAATGLDASHLDVRLDEARATFKAEASWGATYEVVLVRAQVLKPGPGLRPLLTCADGLLVASVDRGDAPPVMLITDPDLINNQGLGKGDHAEILAGLLAHLDGVHALVFDETLHGDVRRGELLASLLRFPVLPVTAHLTVLTLLALWAFSGHFGTPREAGAARAGGREVFIDTTARLLEGSIAEGLALTWYWRHVSDAVSTWLRLPAEDPSERIARLAAAAAAHGTSDDPRALAAEVLAATDGEPKPETWTAVALKIDRWRREMTHGPGTRS
jgi:hypothetical protein